jgi:hypothetical protein
MNLTIALDPGQRVDPAALVIVERIAIHRDTPTSPPCWRWDIAHAQQWALQTPHTVIVDDCVAMVGQEMFEQARFLFDATGVGAVYEDLFRQRFRNRDLKRPAYPLVITAGVLDNGSHIAKRNLVGKYEAKLSNGQIAVRDIPLRKEIAKQHERFRARISKAGQDTYEAAREGKDHDDLLLAAMCATYWNTGAGEPRYLARDGRLYDRREQSADPY